MYVLTVFGPEENFQRFSQVFQDFVVHSIILVDKLKKNNNLTTFYHNELFFEFFTSATSVSQL